MIPKHLNLHTPNPRVDWDRLPVRVTTALTDWPPHPGRPPLAGVSAYGISGTNAHIVLEGHETPERTVLDGALWASGSARKVAILPPKLDAERSSADAEFRERTTRFLPLSGKSGAALRELAQRYLSWLDECPQERILADTAWTAGVGRSHFQHRAGVVFQDLGSLREGLKSLEEADGLSEPRPARKVAFAYTGQGSQWVGMGRELYDSEPVARMVLDRCEAVFREARGASLLDVMFGRPDASGDLSDTDWEQPALYALGCALTALWASVGVQPDMVLGHSVGEIAAAQAAGVFGLEDGIRLAAARGTLLSETEDGAMAAVFAPRDLVSEAVESYNTASTGVGVSIAADNGAHQVVSGREQDIEAITERFEYMELRVRRLNTGKAFHSALVEPALDPLESVVADLATAPPMLPLVSNVTGRVLKPGETLDCNYWRKHARQAVEFAGGVNNLAALGVDLVVEIGPHSVLGPMVSMAWPESIGGGQPSLSPVVLSSLLRPPKGAGEPEEGFVNAVARAYEAGVDISFPGLFSGESRRRVSLPSYPFQRRRIWVEGARRRRSGPGHPLLGARHESPRGEVLFESEVSASYPAWLTDHRVHGRIVAPGALYGAMAALAQLSEEAGPVVVEDMQLHSPLILPGEANSGDQEAGVRRLQLVMDVAEGAQSRVVGIYSKGGEGGWTQHVEGRVSAGIGVPESEAWADLESLKAGLSQEEVRGFYQTKSASGIDFGPAFRVVRDLWSGPGEALGEITLPSDVDRSGIDIPPLLLDGCFQILAASRSEDVRGQTTYMPFGWERMWLVGRLPDQIVCHVRLREDIGEHHSSADRSEPPETLTADLWIYALDGAALGGLSGFTVKRATRAALLSAVEGLNDLFYEIVWQDRPLGDGLKPADFLPCPSEVAVRAGPFDGYLSYEGVESRQLYGFLVEMEVLTQLYALSALERLGWECRAGMVIDPEELRERMNILPRHGRLLRRMLALLSDAGILAAEGEGFVVSVGSHESLPEAALGDLAEFVARLGETYPHAWVELAMMSRCGEALPDVLQGRKEPLEVLFSVGEPGAPELYKVAPVHRAMNHMLGEAVGAAVSALPEDRRLRVLEVGAGTGSGTTSVLPKLPPGRFDYTFTDVSAGFFADAEAIFNERKEPAEFRVLDLEMDPVAQGFDPHGYDIVVASQVLHATRDLKVTLSHCLQLLAPSGQLVAQESLTGESWRDLVFGVLEGWWLFDDEYRTDNVMPRIEAWRRALADAGFADMELMGSGGPEGTTPSERVMIVAQAPAVVSEPSGLWILTADQGGVATELATQLTAKNQTAIIAGDNTVESQDEPGVVRAVVDAGRRESWRSLLEAIPLDVPLNGVVHLTALDGHGTGATAGELKEDMTRITGSALALVQGLIDADATPNQGVFFVTRGAQVLERECSGELAGATLWGLEKVISREASNLRPRVIDLDPAKPGLPEGLINELLHPDPENNIAYRADRRMITRLVRSGRQTAQDQLQEKQVRDDRTYLVTGGLGGIGCAVASWLADQGAGAIVLNGRRHPDPAAEEVIAALRQRGARVQVELADMADEVAVEEMLSRIDATLPPLGGVIHSVGALSDASLANQSREGFESVLWPKALGAWHLHRATVGRDLDLFVLFSSMAGVRGNLGQSNYAAANAFLDQLARHRRSLGLPGQAVQWGAWAGVGEAEEHRDRIAVSLAAFGSGWMTPQQGIRALDRLVRQDAASTGVGIMDWPVFAASLPSPMPLIEDLLPAATAQRASTSAHEDNLLSRLREPAADREELLVSFLQRELQTVLRLPSPPSPSVRFFELGMDSLMAVELRNRLNRALAGEYMVPNTIVFDYPDTASLARHLAGEIAGSEGATAQSRQQIPKQRRVERRDDSAIAIVGMACRFPGAENLTSFWRLIEAGGNAVTDGRNGPGSWKGCFGDPSAEESIYRRGAFVDRLDQFDARFFRMAPVQARTLDPQQRMLMETTWQALEDAGIDPTGLRGSRTGVYCGMGISEYRDITASGGLGGSFFGTSASMAVGRVAYELGLEGPTMPVELACASSLVAVHQAVASLQKGETQLALAGGVNAVLSPAVTREMAEIGMLSWSGQCRSFDADADGFVRGEGCGVLVLKRLEDAEADGDRIWGVIRGSAVNQNGASAGPTAPNGPAQQRVIEDALSQAKVSGQDVDYLEAHGLGSKLGDPIEIQAAAAAYGRERDATRPLLIGSVKANIGHLEAASGIASLIKTVLVMNRRVIPGQLHFQNPNANLEWERLPVQVTSATRDWPSHPGRLPLAGVSALGISGTNAHVVVQGYGEPDGSEFSKETWVSGPRRKVPIHLPEAASGLQFSEEGLEPRRERLLPLSGKSEDALRELAELYLSWISEELEGLDAGDGAAGELLADMAWTASVGRSHLDHRVGVVFRDATSLREELRAVAAATDDLEPRTAQKAAFLYTGRGSQTRRMGRGLYECEPVARAVLDRCEEVFRNLTGASLLDATSDSEDSRAGLEAAACHRAGLYAVGCALTTLWGSVGVQASVMAGRDGGELAAAQALGLISLEYGMRLAVVGGQLPAEVEALPRNIVVGEQGVDLVVEIGSDAGFVEAVARSYETGLNVSFVGLFAGESRRRVSLPTYPFQRRRYWMEAPMLQKPESRA